MAYLYIKALHIIFVVTWFAGLFYIVRLFIYQTEAAARSEPERSILVDQYKIMARRLWYGITWPSAVITLVMGLGLLHNYIPDIPLWLWIKIAFVLGLFIYQFICHKIFLQLQHGIVRHTSQKLRVWNEVATVFLVSIVFLAILKNALSMLYGLAGLAVFTAILLLGIYIYKRKRKS
jgi:putative membrane protein